MRSINTSRLILLAGFAPGRATPFTVTLFVINVVPAGILSTKITLFAATFPSLVTFTVYVNTSLIVAVCRSTDFCKLTFARFTVVCTVFEEAVLVIGGLPTKDGIGMTPSHDLKLDSDSGMT